ncbi:MAG: hypothetical protein CME64_09530 [Halobacteriovoraceae bacterium]|nr:hypothetical protein [Halobacteriovoraceae bacterium]|tara:strand:- start:31880 stop:32509 length:630 start_codon:yes stop_codon:yes gene_type:complete
MFLGLILILIFSGPGIASNISSSHKSIVVTKTNKNSPLRIGFGLTSSQGIDQVDDVDSDALTHDVLGVGMWLRYIMSERYSLEVGASRLTKEYSVSKNNSTLVEQVQKFQAHLLGRYEVVTGFSLGAGGFSDFKSSNVDRGESQTFSSGLDTSASKSTYGPLLSLAYEKDIRPGRGLFANVNYMEPIETESGEESTKYYFMIGFTFRPE